MFLKKCLCAILTFVIIFSASQNVYAGFATDKGISLGLDVVSATADAQSLEKGTKAAMKKTSFDWIWEYLGGVEKIAFNSSDAELTGMRDKVNFIIDTVKKVQSIGTQLGEGNYDQAAITALDIAVNKINNPAVSAVWAAVKATYISYQLVADTQAELEIEQLYNIVNKDRRLIGESSKNGPALININAGTVDYFFNDYLVTNDTVRGYVKNYVQKKLGEKWPEQTWGEYMSSFMAIGSGVDQKKAAETEALTTEFKQTARHWINELLKDVNKQAQVAYNQLRLRQKMAAYNSFADKVGMYYNNDFPRMWKEFQDMRAMKARIPEYKALLAKSLAQYPIYRKKLNNPKHSELMKEAGSLFSEVSGMRNALMTAYSSANLVGQEGLGSQLSTEFNKWRKLVERASEIIEDGKGEGSGVDDSGITYTDDKDYVAIDFGRVAKILKPYKWRGGQGSYHTEKRTMINETGNWDVSNVKTEIVVKQGSIDVSDSALQKVLSALNKGDFKKAKEEMPNWPAVEETINRYYGEMDRQILFEADIFDPAYKDKLPGFSTLYETSFVDYCTMHDISMKHYYYFYLETGSNQQVLERIYQAFTTLRDKDLAYIALRRKKFDSAYNAFMALKAAAQKRYSAYTSSINFIKSNLSLNACQGAAGTKIEPSDTYQSIKVFPDVSGAAFLSSFLKMTSVRLFARARHLTGTHEQSLTPYFKQFEEQLKSAKQAWKSMPKLTGKDIKAIEVLVLKGEKTLDVAKDQRAIENRIQEMSQCVSALQSSLARAANVDVQERTTSDNLFKDAAFLSTKSLEVKGFIDHLLASDLISQKYNKLVLTLKTDEKGRAIAETPYRHYLTQKELDPISQELKALINNGPVFPFIRSYFPLVSNELQSLMDLSDIVLAKGENIIIANQVVYAKDIKEAQELVRKIDPTSKKYDSQMAKIAQWLPYVLNVPNDKEIEHYKQEAKVYGLSFEEYQKKILRKDLSKPDYTFRDFDFEGENLDKSKLGKAYLKLREKIKELTAERIGFFVQQRQEENRKKAEEESARIAEEQRKVGEAQGIRELDSRDAFGLAGFYGYSIENPRLNSHSLSDARGEVILTKGDLVAGEISVEARLFTLDKATTLLLSKDGGQTWEELPLSRNIRFAFNPLPNKPYDFILRIKTTDGREPRVRIFNSVNSFTYKDIDLNQLIVETVKEIANAYERSDLSTFSDHISRDYLGNKAMLEEGVRFDFDMFTNIRLTIYINHIEERRGLFVTETKWDKTQNPRTTGQEQRTSGKTTFMFVLEDGQMKIKNLRGDLIYATLSPEIAQASGKSSSVVDDIRTARDNRNPTQPGAGTTEDAGGVTSSSSSTTLTVYTSAVINVPGWPGTGFDFTANTEISVASPNSDVDFEGSLIFGTNGFQKMTGYTFTSLTTAPTSGYTTGGIANAGAGTIYTFITNEGYYGKMEVLSFADNPGGNLQFKFAVQTDGSKNLSTQ